MITEDKGGPLGRRCGCVRPNGRGETHAVAEVLAVVDRRIAMARTSVAAGGSPATAYPALIADLLVLANRDGVCHDLGEGLRGAADTLARALYHARLAEGSALRASRLLAGGITGAL